MNVSVLACEFVDHCTVSRLTLPLIRGPLPTGCKVRKRHSFKRMIRNKRLVLPAFYCLNCQEWQATTALPVKPSPWRWEMNWVRSSKPSRISTLTDKTPAQNGRVEHERVVSDWGSWAFLKVKTRPIFSLQRLPGLVFLDLLRLLLIGSPSNQKRRLEMLLNLLEI